MQVFINAILKFIKYPLAIFSALCCIPLLESLMHFVGGSLNTHLTLYFLLPVLAVIVLWIFIPTLSGSSLTIFAHEATHMLAAIITFHKPKSISIEEDKGGSFTYQGKGNWLITTAPYFIPLFPLLWMIITLFFGENYKAQNWYLMTFGALVGFHIAANFTQIHAEQTDFKKAGWLFSFLFLPGANALLIGYLWAFAIQDWAGLSLWTNAYLPRCQTFLHQLLTSILSLLG